VCSFRICRDMVSRRRCPVNKGWLAVAEALVKALRERCVEAPAIVGYSMGGYRALTLARIIRAF
jgi:hypothetical protein